MQWPDTGSGKESAISSPVSPLPVRDIMPRQSPVIQTLHDNKQWVDLDYLSPKLIRELCRQYGPPPEQDSTSTISKGAAKVRAWARHSKLGIDIRLRRKLNLEHDEVTDIRLIPEPRAIPREKPAPVAELPGQPHEIQELPDNSRARELACPPARGLSGSSLDDNVDPLPRYEPTSSSGNEMSSGCHATAPDAESRSASSATISSTPDRVSSPPGTRFNCAVNGDTLDKAQKRVHTNTNFGYVSNSSAEFRALHVKLEQANERLDQERSAKERFEKLLADVRRELTSEREASRGERETSSTNPFLDGLRVSNTATYETQTGVAPPSPAENSYDQAADNDQHEDPLQNPSQTNETTYDQSSLQQAWGTFRRDRAQQRTSLPVLKTTFHPVTKDPSPIVASAIETPTADPWMTYASPHKSDMSTINNIASVPWAVLTRIIKILQWIQSHYGPPQPVAQDRSRVKWTCSCGEELFDDFVELRPGAARELEAYLNRPRTYTGGSPTSPSSSQGSRSFTGSSVGGVPSANTSWSSYGFQNTSPGGEDKLKVPGVSTSLPFTLPFFNQPEPPWLLTCANEGRATPKLAHLDMAPHNIRSDKDLAMALRNHYFEVNNKWWRALKLRGLATIDFVQFEVHQNRFADIRKSPDMPLPGQDYAFEPGDLMPPMGSKKAAVGLV
ncbi:hypothetical protein D0864_04905 [Hortaea werneckii]|uniref:Uncharacterized protein n=1 Tax=Hortaea werneckii TaxID=91943 RepID=A0A3M7G7J9_HORWE|nr:hypothetical protein D0864_04905 [Hortaea werneckii]